MEEIRYVGSRQRSGHYYKFSIFKCPSCNKLIEKVRKDGVRAKYCSHKCYAKNRELRGAYKSGFVMITGYRYKYQPDHPQATKKGYVAVHRLVAESKIGRPLKDNEIAHHKNEIKTDNRKINIQVMTKSEHSKHHQNFRKCKIVS